MSRLAPEARAAFMEGLRAYHDGGNELRVSAEQGVLTTYDPPRLISLHLVADGFAARGDAALHDPQGTVAALLERLPATERPGVLHLRPGWLDGEVDGMDRAAFAAAVRQAVCPEQVEGVETWSSDERIGALQLSVVGRRPQPAEKAESQSPRVEQTPDEVDAAKAPEIVEVLEVAEGLEVAEVAKASEAPEVAGGAEGPEVVGSVEAVETPKTAVEPVELVEAGAGAGAGAEVKAGGGVVAPATVVERAAGARGGSAVNTMMLDLARVLDGYVDAREKQPDAAAESLLREVAAGVIAAGGPGLTWTKPPTQAELRIVLPAAGAPAARAERTAEAGAR
ncbi:hypothetical protein [Nonomuraea zeae]|uniref:Uncharacterized protein n=1 Tax=Nonomuraea zeae TaxID=1642303 RepID=A0A5S4EXS0_9ACTN|nr:hypothetical protein ETD85_62350 [Nonomuraea zeae]